MRKTDSPHQAEMFATQPDPARYVPKQEHVRSAGVWRQKLGAEIDRLDGASGAKRPAATHQNSRAA
jgi:hypothetical protein